MGVFGRHLVIGTFLQHEFVSDNCDYFSDECRFVDYKELWLTLFNVKVWSLAYKEKPRGDFAPSDELYYRPTLTRMLLTEKHSGKQCHT